jgi:hypothetical protein
MGNFCTVTFCNNKPSIGYFGDYRVTVLLILERCQILWNEKRKLYNLHNLIFFLLVINPFVIQMSMPNQNCNECKMDFPQREDSFRCWD